jgi:hypothetical protein
LWLKEALNILHNHNNNNKKTSIDSIDFNKSEFRRYSRNFDDSRQYLKEYESNVVSRCEDVESNTPLPPHNAIPVLIIGNKSDLIDDKRVLSLSLSLSLSLLVPLS